MSSVVVSNGALEVFFTGDSLERVGVPAFVWVALWTDTGDCGGIGLLGGLVFISFVVLTRVGVLYFTREFCGGGIDQFWMLKRHE